MTYHNYTTVKVVLNKCWGGFGLSRKGVDRLVELGFKLAPGDVAYLNADGDKPWFSMDPKGLKRHDPLLVQVVEELGSEASGYGAKLEITTVDLYYCIADYNGRERIVD